MLLNISESHLTVERAHRIFTTPAVSQDKLMCRPNRKSTNQLYSYRVEASAQPRWSIPDFECGLVE